MSEKFVFAKNLYLGSGIKQEKLDKIKSRIQKHPLMSGMYVLTISCNPSDQLEIYSVRQMFQRYYMDHPIYVVGLAKNYDDAVELTVSIVNECLKERNDCNIKDYLLCGQSLK